MSYFWTQYWEIGELRERLSGFCVDGQYIHLNIVDHLSEQLLLPKNLVAEYVIWDTAHRSKLACKYTKEGENKKYYNWGNKVARGTWQCTYPYNEKKLVLVTTILNWKNWLVKWMINYSNLTCSNWDIKTRWGNKWKKWRRGSKWLYHILLQGIPEFWRASISCNEYVFEAIFSLILWIKSS